jgi:hypothetical protein
MTDLLLKELGGTGWEAVLECRHEPDRSAPESELVANIEALEDKLVQTYLPGLRETNSRILKKAARALGYLGRPQTPSCAGQPAEY